MYSTCKVSLAFAHESWLELKGHCRTYIRVIPDLLNGGLVEVTSIALEAVHLEGVLQAVKDVVRAEDAASLAELKALLLTGAVNILEPVVVLVGLGLTNVVLELDDVGIGDGIGLNGAENGSRALVNGANLESAGLGNSGHGESDSGSHCDECDGIEMKNVRVSTCDKLHRKD